MFYTSSIDSTDVTTNGARLGRLINHSRKYTAKPKVIEIDGVPHVCFFASRDMNAGEELLFDYGIRNLPFKDMVRHITYCTHLLHKMSVNECYYNNLLM